MNRDLRKGFEFLFLEQIDGPFLRGPMNPLVFLLRHAETLRFTSVNSDRVYPGESP